MTKDEMRTALTKMKEKWSWLTKITGFGCETLEDCTGNAKM